MKWIPVTYCILTACSGEGLWNNFACDANTPPHRGPNSQSDSRFDTTASERFDGSTVRNTDANRGKTAGVGFDQLGIVIGDRLLASRPVVDGDTVRIHGSDTSLRLLAIDTEEKFRGEQERTQFQHMPWQEYVATKRDNSKRPVKMATPMGDEATRWARAWFRQVARVRLERDHPKEIHGGFGRYLVYIFAYKNGQWLNYNLECVRAGMSPYFTKYGYSRRFHAEFVAAQSEARRYQRGIWSPLSRAYPDYEERLAWWKARADFVRTFESDSKASQNKIALSRWDADERLQASLERPVDLLGTVSSIRLGKRGPHKVWLKHPTGNDIALVYFDKALFRKTGASKMAGEFVRVFGTLSTWRNRHTSRNEMQIIIQRGSQVTSSAPHTTVLSPSSALFPSSALSP